MSSTDEGTGGFDLGGLLQQAQDLQRQLIDAQSRAAETVVEGQSGGGMVKVRVNGALEFLGVEISRDVIDPDDPEMLQDLVLAALRDAARALGELQQQSIGGFDPSSLDLGGIGELFGGGPGQAGALGESAEESG